MDQFDQAQELDARYRRQALDVWQQDTKDKQALTNIRCDDCGGVIPARRRLAAPGCTRCRDCQQQWEDDRK